MASREERMQQRLRGAQRRQIKDVDFGLVFPSAAPAEEEPAPQPEPQLETIAPEILPQLSSRPTPARAPEQLSNTPVISENRKPLGSHTTIDANTSAKRRKLDSDDATVSSARSTRSRPPPRSDNVALADEPQEDSLLSMLLDTTNDSINKESGPVASAHKNVVPATVATHARAKTPALPAPLEEEITEIPRDAPGSGYRVRLRDIDAGLTTSQFLSTEGDTTIMTESETPIQRNKRKRGSEAREASAKRSKKLHDDDNNNESLEMDELSPEQRRLPSIPDTASRSPVSDQRRAGQDQSALAQDELEEAEAIDDLQTAIVLKRNQGRRKSRGAPLELPELGDVSASPVARKRRGRHRVEPSPVQQRQPKQAAPKVKAKGKQAKTSKIGPVGSPIQVTVHRFTKPVVYDDNDEEEADILTSGIPHTKRSGVNAIDVLGEVCTEVIESMLEILENGRKACDDAALRREYITKWKAVTAFGSVLQTRLLEQTINLDNGYALERRLRDENKKKLRLREEILRVRAEREQIALRMDEVRLRHDNERVKAHTQASLNSNIHDIEMTVDLGKQRQDGNANQSTDLVGTEVLLKRLAREVSNKGDSGGLLNQVKEFNAFLERAAVALESRMA